MWTCSCSLQGVGECANIHLRFPDYEKVFLDKDLDPDSFSCSIEQHFAREHNSLDDVCFVLVDSLGPKPARLPWVIRCLRKRLENRWIHKLDAQLNKNKYLHTSFSGDSAARAEDKAGWNTQLAPTQVLPNTGVHVVVDTTSQGDQ